MAALLSFSVVTFAEAQPGYDRSRAHAPTRSLPRAHSRIVHNGHTYFYNEGRFYRQSSGLYMSITAPLGAIIPSLPITVKPRQVT